MLSPMYIFSAHNIRLALSALHDDLEALHCSSDGPNMGPGGGLCSASPRTTATQGPSVMINLGCAKSCPTYMLSCVNRCLESECQKTPR